MPESLSDAVVLEALSSYLGAAAVAVILGAAAIRHRLTRPTSKEDS